jgi:hypothetical protein
MILVNAAVTYGVNISDLGDAAIIDRVIVVHLDINNITGHTSDSTSAFWSSVFRRWRVGIQQDS